MAVQAWAVVSTIPGDVEVVGTSRGFDQAEVLLRRTGRANDPESRGLVYLVRRSDGGFR